jgi:hypothetical protein
MEEDAERRTPGKFPGLGGGAKYVFGVKFDMATPAVTEGSNAEAVLSFTDYIQLGRDGICWLCAH